ncbi:MAG: tripartite tricarboxylate transporter substrate binding protein [Alphaproteobacteria bacterium]|nr:tripartite tricarboxylate transporter substrate binding protein [Alphaproteobacteria bacterium]
MSPRCLLVPCIAFALVMVSTPRAAAQDYPAHGVAVVVPFTPAGSTDLLARMAAQAWEQRLGKPFVVENRPGAGQQIGVNTVAKAAPDGYTLLMATSSAMGVNPTLYKKIAYDPVTDFQPIAMMAHLPFILVVNNDLPVKNLAEFIAYAKANPGKLSYGSGGVGASHHLYGEMFNSLAGVKMTHVPYKGTVPALNDVIAGHIQVLFSDAPPALPQIAGGKVRALGVTTAKRIEVAKDIPPLNETLKGFDSAPWQMLMAPAGTPGPVIDKLHKEMVAYIASAEGQAKLKEMGLVPGAPTAPAELAKFVKKEVGTWGDLVKKAGAAGIE